MYRLPLFPLPVVLLPATVMPLHIFEPRYREMVARCLELDRRFGLVYHDPDRMGPFQMESGRVGTVAEIGEFRPLPGGRSLLLAHGRHRFRIEDGVESETPYYEAVVSDLEDEEPEDPEELYRLRRGAVELLEVALSRFGSEPGEASDGVEGVDPGLEVSFQIAARIRLDPVWQQDLLVSTREEDRLRRIQRLLSGALGEDFRGRTPDGDPM